MTSPLSRDVWIALERRFMDQSAAQEMQLRFDLKNLQKGTKPMATYLRELKAICDALAAINAPVLNKDMVIHALAGLPYEYESFTTTITKMNANIISHLLILGLNFFIKSSCNVGESSDSRVSIRQVPTGRKRRKKGLAYSRSQ